MTLRNDVRTSICTAMTEWADGHESNGIDVYVPELADLILGAVWSVMEEKVGSVQEKLLLDVQNARAELRHAQNRVSVLVEMNDGLRGQLEQLSSQH